MKIIWWILWIFLILIVIVLIPFSVLCGGDPRHNPFCQAVEWIERHL